MSSLPAHTEWCPTIFSRGPKAVTIFTKVCMIMVSWKDFELCEMKWQVCQFNHYQITIDIFLLKISFKNSIIDLYLTLPSVWDSNTITLCNLKSTLFKAFLSRNLWKKEWETPEPALSWTDTIDLHWIRFIDLIFAFLRWRLQQELFSALAESDCSAPKTDSDKLSIPLFLRSSRHLDFQFV